MNEKLELENTQVQLLSFYLDSEASSLKSLLLSPLQNQFYKYEFHVFRFLTQNPKTGFLFFQNFPLFRKTAEKQLFVAQQSILKSAQSPPTSTLKQYIDLRFISIPTPHLIYFNKHPHFTPQLLTRLTLLRCKIVKMSQKRVREKVQKFACQKCCHINQYSLEDSENTLNSNVLKCQNTKDTKSKSQYNNSILPNQAPLFRRCHCSKE